MDIPKYTKNLGISGSEVYISVVSVLGIILMVWGKYFRFGFSDPYKGRSSTAQGRFQEWHN